MAGLPRPGSHPWSLSSVGSQGWAGTGLSWRCGGCASKGALLGGGMPGPQSPGPGGPSYSSSKPTVLKGFWTLEPERALKSAPIEEEQHPQHHCLSRTWDLSGRCREVGRSNDTGALAFPTPSSKPGSRLFLDSGCQRKPPGA